MKATNTATNTNVRPLANEISKNGFTYKLIKRTQNTAMYGQYHKERSGAEHKPFAIEVFTVKIGGGLMTFGGVPRMVEPYEVFPGDNAFGKTAESFGGPEREARAEAKFIERENNAAKAVVVEVEEEELELA